MEQLALRVSIPVCGRALSGHLFKGAGEVVTVGKPDVIADLGDGEIGVCEQGLCQLHFFIQDIGFQRFPRNLFEKSGDVFFIVAKIGGNLAHLNIFPNPPGDVIDYVGVELGLFTFHDRVPAGEVYLAVELAQGRGQHVAVQILIAVFAAAVLQLFQENDQAVQPGNSALSGQKDPGLSGVQGAADVPVIIDGRIVPVIIIRKMSPVKFAERGLKAVLALRGGHEQVFAFPHGVAGALIRDKELALSHYDPLKIREDPGHVGPALVRGLELSRPVKMDGLFYRKI